MRIMVGGNIPLSPPRYGHSDAAKPKGGAREILAIISHAVAAQMGQDARLAQAFWHVACG
ncbi:hypothetical protein KUD11_04005 [Roseovarius sp. LXJ103]|uniref:hypothetical protein n=1 Tax=Roseovarius carneus TaxID=2853164 RepID=UPI0015E812A7|nr:hypothetical protein [Roseovarius carneus]MBZ8117802.1 hypothetical protein [Roseovarius carneus]